MAYERAKEYNMTKEQMAVFELIWNLINGKTDRSKVDFTPQKISFPEEIPYEQAFMRAVPETQGISSAMIRDLIEELRSNEGINMHHIMILRNGCVIGETSFAPYRQGMWHITHSMCKSITGMAVGLLVAEGRLELDDRIHDIFAKKNILGGLFRQKNVTVRDLLTMTSGIVYNEAGALSGNEWTKSFLESSVKGTSGTVFDYNSMNTYMLSAIVTEITGETLTEYLTPRLFEPLGLTKFFWETCPKGITKGGWGLFLLPEDAAKLGQLYLQQGKWLDRQIIPAEWVKESTTKQVDTPPEKGGNGYGYQIWMGGRPGSFLFNGMLGQNVIVYPDLQMVIVAHAGSREIFQKSTLMDVIGRYFENDFVPGIGKETVLPEENMNYGRLLSIEEAARGVKENLPLIEKGGWNRCCIHKKRRQPRQKFVPDDRQWAAGRVYDMEQKHVGLAPLMLQVLHNNYSEGISRMGFLMDGGRFYLEIQEGEDNHKIEIGFQGARTTAVKLHEEEYLVVAEGKFSTDEENRRVLKIRITFLEEAVSREVKFYFRNEEAEIRWNETPGKDVIMKGLDSFAAMPTDNLIINNLRGMVNPELFYFLIERTIQPIVTGHLTGTI